MSVDLFTQRGLPHIPHPPLADMFEIQGDCWEWQGFINHDGYGRIHTGGRREGGHQMVHRVFYESLVAPIPEGHDLDHLCRNRPCVNPDHLEPVTNAENVRRGVDSRTHCRNGHPRTESSFQANGKRVCGICKRQSMVDWYERKYRSEGRTLDFECDCGRAFVSRRALGVHRGFSHK